MMVWAVTGMALFRSHSMNQLVSHLDILLPGKLPRIMEEILNMVSGLVLPGRRERHYPRAEKKRPQRYALRPPSKLN